MAVTNIPIQLTSFVGRERELADVQRLFSSARLVTLSGAGGCGKTRLAIEVAGTLSDTCPDGAWLVDLAALREPALVPQLVAQTLGVHPPPTDALLEALLTWLRPKRLLLILDNCEHLIEACARFAQELLSKAPELRVLATSREALALAGERLYQLQGLAWPALAEPAAGNELRERDLQDLMHYDAVRLFVERARAIAPAFTITAETVQPIVEICRRLDGIPLALELASARVNVLTVHQIAARLDDRFALLTAGPRAARVPHHQTLRAAIDWSYALLTAEEQTLLRRLAVLASGFTLDTAEAVCSGDGIAAGRMLDLVSSLVAQSLVVAETSSRAQARFRLLETIREYALDKLDAAGEAARLRNRHLELFLARAERAAPKLHDTYQQLWLNWLEGEHDNLRAALAWAIECGRVEAGLRIAIAITRFWEIRGYVREGLTWFERLLAQSVDDVPGHILAHAYSFAAFLADFLGRGELTQRYGQQAVTLAEAAGSAGRSILGLALGALGAGARAVGDNQRAFEIAARCVELYRDEPLPAVYLGMTLLVQGGLAIELGDYGAAQAALEQSLRIAQAAGDAFRSAHAINTLGDLARCEGQHATARERYTQSITLFRKIGATRDLAAPLLNLGHACLHLGEVAHARALFEESLAIMEAEQLRVWPGQPALAEGLLGFAALAIVGGLPAAGARLLAAARAFGAQHAKFSWAVTRIEYENCLALARARLGEAEFQAEQEAGRALSLEQAIVYAQNLPLPSQAVPATRERSDDLTPRESEIAALVARGHSNSAIAGELVLSKRTVEKHIANILAKLALTSRAQIVRWAIEHNLS